MKAIVEQDQVSATALMDHTATIVAAYVSHNSIASSEIANLIGGIYQSLSSAGVKTDEEAPKLTPAVPPRKSVTPDYIICLEDGKKFKSMKRHLRINYNLTPEQYRDKWGLDPDYPMVAPAYSQKRSVLAKASRLGYHRSWTP